MVGTKVRHSIEGSRLSLIHRSFPQILRKSLWKLDTRLLQSCYKRILRTLCTRERRAEKALRMNVLTLLQATDLRRVVQPKNVVKVMQETCDRSVNKSRVLCFADRSTNCGTNENRYAPLAPNRRRTLF